MSTLGVMPMAERVRLRIDDLSVELTLGEAMSIRDSMSDAIDLIRDDRSVVLTLADLVADLPTGRRRIPG